MAALARSWTGYGVLPSETISLDVIRNATGAVEVSVNFTNNYRTLLEVYSIETGDIELANMAAVPAEGYGNSTIGYITVAPRVTVNGSLIVAGNFFDPTSPIDFFLGTVPLGSYSVNASGFFNVTLTIPEVGIGTYDVTITNAGVDWLFRVEVIPTLILIPDSGPAETVVNAYGYGYPAAGTPSGYVYNVTLYWWEMNLGDATWWPLGWILTDSNGRFMTSFVVPHVYGGPHDVIGIANDTAATNATDIFTITPVLVIDPVVFANNASLVVSAIGSGFDPRSSYVANIDNQYLGFDAIGIWTQVMSIIPNATGDIEVQFIGAGFRPGEHVFSMYVNATPPGSHIMAPAVWAGFTVTTEGDPILLDIENGTVTLLTEMGSIQTLLSEINAKIVNIENGQVTIASSLGTIKTCCEGVNLMVESIEGDVATIKTDLGSISGKVTSIDGNVATIKTDVGTVKSEISGAKTSVEGISLPIYAAVILALIAAVAAIACVIQISRKIAG
jgi:hypothetical protein